MNSFSDPILVVCQLKSFQTNQINLLKQKLKGIDAHATIQRASERQTPFSHLCKSSTFIFTFSDLTHVKNVFGEVRHLNTSFVNMHSTGIECLVLGAFFQNQLLSVDELMGLASFESSKLNILGNLLKTVKLPIFLKQRLTRLPFVLKANNGN